MRGCISHWKPTANIPYTPRQIATAAADDRKPWRREMPEGTRTPPKYATTGAIYLVAHTGRLVQFRPIEPLAQDQEPEPPGRAAAARGGMEWLTSPGHSKKWSRPRTRPCASGSSAPSSTAIRAVENDFHADVVLHEDLNGNGEWRVEYQDDDGACYVTIFAGPESRAARTRLFHRAQDRRPQDGPRRAIGALKQPCRLKRSFLFA